jgi:Glycosyl hydrolases family 16
MRLGARPATLGFATAIATTMVTTMMFVGCSNPPPQTGTPGSAGTNAQGGAGTTAQGGAGTNAQGGAGTTGGAGTSGGAGTTSGGAGTVAAAGTSGGAGTGAAGTTAPDGGAAGSGAAGTAAGGGGTGAGCPAGVKGHCNADTPAVTVFTGFHLALAEEFDEAINLDTDPIWTWSDGGPPEGQTRFQEGQITFAGGQMILTAVAKQVPSSISYAEPDPNKTTGMPGGRSVASGEFRTKYNNYRYGRYEAKYQAPVENAGGTAGNYLSTMFTFRTPKWKEWRELDNELEANIKGLVAYNMVNADGQNNYPGGDAGSKAPGMAGFTITAMHTYMIEWLPTKVTWYVDGTALRSNGNTPPIPVKSAKIMMNLWVFASAAAFGDPSKNVYPFHSTYESFHFYKWDQETTYPVDDPKTQLMADDTASSQNNSKEMTYP